MYIIPNLLNIEVSSVMFTIELNSKMVDALWLDKKEQREKEISKLEHVSKWKETSADSLERRINLKNKHIVFTRVIF